jgi:hypothetical protein
MRRAIFLGLIGITAALTTALPASAGVPECGNIRFDGLSNCEVRVSGECSASCSELGIYKVACATKLVPVCKQECTLSAMPTCSDSCTVQCKSDCDNGVNVICSHNCFTECTTTRDTECSASTDAAQCSATWDANCDSECDANMDCQTTCQDEVFEDCEHEFRANCEASCTGDGALFCSGKYILSGSQIPACIQALAAEGIKVKAEANVTLGPDGVNGDVAAGVCTYSPGNKASLAAPFAVLAAAAAGWLARRRKRS